MVAIFTGAGAGLERGSAAILGKAGLLGGSSLGRGGEQVFLNAATGNLLIQRQDEFLVGRGPDVAIARTYNSLADAGDDNNDNWRQSTDRRVFGLTGTQDTTGSTIKRVSGDGSVVTYSWNGSAYVASDGAGAHDQLVYSSSSSSWTWTDGDSRMTETYASDGVEWRIAQQQDADGNALTYTYQNGNVFQITTLDGGYTQYSWDGGNIIQIVTGFDDLATSSSDTITLTRTRYTYDTSNRLSTVVTDLTPGDHSVTDNISYGIGYTYHGSSKRVATISQTDGAFLAIGYYSSNRVETLTQTVTNGVTRVTTIGYGTDYATVTDSLNNVTRLDFDTGGGAEDRQLKTITAPAPHAGSAAQVTQFEYSTSGDLLRVIDPLGEDTEYTYDARGNLLTSTDRQSGVVTRTYDDAANRLLTETRYGADAAGANNPHTTRYAYDAEGHLVYEVSAEGRVVRHLYTTAGERFWSVNFPDDAYDLSTLASSSTALTETQLDEWCTDLGDTGSSQLSYTIFDARGNVKQRMQYVVNDGFAWLEPGSNYEQENFVYDQAGQLLSRQKVGQNAETFVYDGLGRQVASVDLRTGTTSVAFNDGANQTVVTLANGLVRTSTFNKAGDLVSSTESGEYVTAGTATYQYDAAGRLRVLTDAGNKNHYSLYDKLDRKVADITHDGDVVEYRYDLGGRLAATIRYATRLTTADLATVANVANDVALTTVRPGGNASDLWTWSIHDDEGRLVEAIDGDGGVTTYAYDASGRLITTTSYAAKLTAAQVAGFKATLPAAAVLPTADPEKDVVARNFYDKDGRLIAVLDGEGYLGCTTFNMAGNKVVEVSFADAVPAAERASGTLEELVAGLASAGDRRTRYVYDGQGRLRYVIDALHQVTGYQYESEVASGSIGLVRTKIDYAGTLVPGDYRYATVKAAVDQHLNVLEGNRVSYAVFDSAGQLAYKIDGAGGVTGYSHDIMGNVTRTIQYDTLTALSALPTKAAMDSWAAGQAGNAANRVARNYYTDRNELHYAVDAADYVTSFGYDALGQKTAETRWPNTVAVGDSATAATVAGLLTGTGATTQYGYDPGGRLAYVIDGEGSRTSYGYYANGTLEFEYRADATADTSITRYSYDGAGRLKEQRDGYLTAEETVVSYGYDGLGNLIAVTDHNGATVRLYDQAGNLTSETNAAAGTTAYEYNSFGELVRTIDARGHSSYSYYDKLGRVEATRDAEDYVTKTTYTLFSEPATVTRHYSLATNTAEIGVVPVVATHAKDATTSFAYNKLGLVTRATDAENHSEYYWYNAFGERRQVQSKLGLVTSFSYDKTGRLHSEYVAAPIHDSSGAVAASGYYANHYFYDARGNLKRHVEALGRPEERETLRSYDKADRLIEIERPAVLKLSQTDHLTTSNAAM